MCMKKFVIPVLVAMCMVGCGRKEPKPLQTKAVSVEKKQPEMAPQEEHLEFIRNEKGFIVHMKDIKILMKHLSTSINHQDWEAIKQDTKKLKKASPVVFTGANKNDLPAEFISLDVKFHLSAQELIGACQAKNKDKATAAFFKVVNSCDECHAKFNPKEASTSWFQ